MFSFRACQLCFTGKASDSGSDTERTPAYFIGAILDYIVVNNTLLPVLISVLNIVFFIFPNFVLSHVWFAFLVLIKLGNLTSCMLKSYFSKEIITILWF